MNWVQANAGWVLTLAVMAWLSYALVRALVLSARRRQPSSPTEEFSRAEKVRHTIRRKIAERKTTASCPPSRAPDRPPPGTPVRRVPPIDPFGGPPRPWWRRLRGWFGGR